MTANTAADNDSTNAEDGIWMMRYLLTMPAPMMRMMAMRPSLTLPHESDATAVITQMDKAITAAAAERATYGSYINRLGIRFR